MFGATPDDANVIITTATTVVITIFFFIQQSSLGGCNADSCHSLVTGGRLGDCRRCHGPSRIHDASRACIFLWQSVCTPRGKNNNASANTTDNNKNNSLASELVFFLEADAAWGNLEETGRTRVDNYGLLQLGIAWTYLKLQRSLDGLPDMIQRLDRAEATLRQQVHPNFVTLALVRAGLGGMCGIALFSSTSTAAAAAAAAARLKYHHHQQQP